MSNINKSASKLKKTGWCMMACLAILISFVASRYLMMNPADYFPEQKEVYIRHPIGLITHIAGSILALFLGPFQFLSGSVSTRYLKLHRWMGRIYLLGVYIGGLGGLYMACFAYGGLPVSVGFSFLALCWLGTGNMAYLTVRKKNFISHRQWMIRNYSLTFAAVTLRLWLPALEMIGGFNFTESYTTVAWLSWVPNLLIAEWIVSNTKVSNTSISA